MRLSQKWNEHVRYTTESDQRAAAEEATFLKDRGDSRRAVQVRFPFLEVVDNVRIPSIQSVPGHRAGHFRTGVGDRPSVYLFRPDVLPYLIHRRLPKLVERFRRGRGICIPRPIVEQQRTRRNKERPPQMALTLL